MAGLGAVIRSHSGSIIPARLFPLGKKSGMLLAWPQQPIQLPVGSANALVRHADDLVSSM